MRSCPTFAIALGSIIASIAVVARAMRLGWPNAYLNLATGFVVTVAFSRLLGPFVLVPVIIAAGLLSMTANRTLFSRPLLVVAWLFAALLVPMVLERFGVFQETWTMVDGGVCSTSAMFKGKSSLDATMLIVGNLVFLLAIAVYSIRVNRASSDARQDLFVQAWHLGQLVPGSHIGMR